MKTILVVDDFASVRFYHESLLKQSGYKTLSARDGMEALALLEKHPVDLVMLDVLMPKMSGTEFLQRVRAMPRFSALPILLVTSEAHMEQLQQLRDTAGVGILPKPILPEALRQEVQRILG